MNEKETRKNKIDNMLEDAGWTNSRENESGGCYREEIHTESMETSDQEGFSDYILYDENMNPIASVEAKSDEKPSIGNLQQSRRYAKTLNQNTPYLTDSGSLPFIYATNGDEIWFKDRRKNAPLKKKIGCFHNLDNLKNKFKNINYNKHYRNLDKYNLPEFDDKLWDHQQEAIENIEKNIRKNKRKILVKMATGTGKTRMAMAETHRLLRSGLVNKVLFIPNTTHLSNQSKASFENYITNEKPFSNSYSVTTFEDSEDNPYIGDVVVTTLQKMYQEINSDSKSLDPSTFDLIITDECHEFIYNKYGQVIDYFDSIILGLTATPAEKTIGYFGDPVYNYGYDDGVSDGHIVPYNKIDYVRTKITMNGVEKNGKTYPSTALGSQITVPSTHREAAKYIKEDTDDDEITLVFAKNDEHARHIVKDFQEVYSDKPDDYIQRITYKVRDDQGRIKALRSTKNQPTIAVTVDMVSTGIDVKPLENIVFLRPVKSPVLYNQMIGRATRTYEFDDGSKKCSFDVYDFVGVRNYFDDVPPFNTEHYKSGNYDNDDSTEGESDNDLEIIYKKDKYMTNKVIFPTRDRRELTKDEFKNAFENYIETKLNSHDELFKKIDNQDYTRKDIEKLENKLRKTDEIFILNRLKTAYETKGGNILDFIYSVVSESDEIILKEQRINNAKKDILNNSKFRFSSEEEEWIKSISNFRKNSKGRVSLSDFTYPPLSTKGGLSSAINDFGSEERLKMIINYFEEEISDLD